MRTEFKIFLTGWLCVMGTFVFSQQKLVTGSGIGQKEITSKRFDAEHSKKSKSDFNAKPMIRETLKARRLKEAEKE
jgi:hypothetical protein